MNPMSMRNRCPLLETLSDETVGVYGCGRTGKALLRALHPVVRELVVFDDGMNEPPRDLREQFPSVQWRFKTEEFDPRVDRYIVSPGVPWSHPVLETARERGIPVWAELELAYRLCDGRIWAITGTNAKSTCVKLVGSLLEARDRDRHVITCGNLGTPFVEAVRRADHPDRTDFVVEVSTFQIEGLQSFESHATLLTNLGDDHRDRHDSLKHYHDLKWELVRRTNERGVRALFQEDSEIRRRAKSLPNHSIRWFDRGGVSGLPWQINERGLHHSGETMSGQDLPGCLKLFPENLMGAIALVGDGISFDEIRRGITNFQPLRYRAEECPVPGPFRVINDSKGTNPHAVLHLVRRLNGPLRLVLGGKGKDTDFAPLFDHLSDRPLREVILAGSDPTVETLVGLAREREIPYRREHDWDRAVKRAVSEARSGETVVLSPGGSSFDAFDDYRDRGEKFTNWVKEATAP